MLGRVVWTQRLRASIPRSALSVADSKFGPMPKGFKSPNILKHIVKHLILVEYHVLFKKSVNFHTCSWISCKFGETTIQFFRETLRNPLCRSLHQPCSPTLVVRWDSPIHCQALWMTSICWFWMFLLNNMCLDMFFGWFGLDDFGFW